MKTHRMPDMKEGGVNVTPLIDVVMCLIIFFMLVAKIGITSGADVKIKPPATLLGAKIEDMGNTLTLNVRDWKKWHEEEVEAAAKAGAAIPAPPLPSELAQPRVVALLEGKMSEPLAVSERTDRPLRRVLEAMVKKNPKLRVIILADRDIRYELLSQVLLECAKANVVDFNFETSKGS